MQQVRMIVAESTYAVIRNHLLPANPKAEEAAFCFARFETEYGFECLEWMPVPVTDFGHRSLFHIELTDENRAKVIKRAHDLNASIIELHSHPKARRAEFSASDQSGFLEFVPHVRWRLKGRPYAAIVVTPTAFDSLAWINDDRKPTSVLQIQAGNKLMSPTGFTYSALVGTNVCGSV
jgi:hypothetical protein